MKAPSPRTIQLTLLAVGVSLLIAAAADVVLVRLGRFDGESIGAPAIAPLLVFTAAIFGVKSWLDERDRHRNEEREKIYVILCTSLLARFAGGPQHDLGQLRAAVAVWGSVDVVAALRDWNRAYDRNVQGVPDANGHQTLTVTQSTNMRAATTKVVEAVRADLQSGRLKDGLEDALFNKL